RHPLGRPSLLWAGLPARGAPRHGLGLSSARADAARSRVSDVRLSAHGPRKPTRPRLVTLRPVPQGTPAGGAVVKDVLLLVGAAVAVALLEILIGALIVDRRPTLEIVTAVLAQPLFARALGNTLLAGGLVVACGSLIALPLAWLIARCDFPGRFAVITLGLL